MKKKNPNSVSLRYNLSDQTKIHTKRDDILVLDIFRSERFAQSHVIARLSDTSLNAFYYTLKTDAYDHSVWNDVTVSKAVQAVPSHLGFFLHSGLAFSSFSSYAKSNSGLCVVG